MWWVGWYLDSLACWFPSPEPVTREVIGIDFVKRRVLWRSVG